MPTRYSLLKRIHFMEIGVTLRPFNWQFWFWTSTRQIAFKFGPFGAHVWYAGYPA